jgi:hypothetical protein
MKRHLQKTLLQGTAVSGTNVYTTEFIPIASLETYAFQVVYTGTPTATVTIEQSFDLWQPNYLSPGVTPAQPTSFVTVVGSSAAPSAGNYLFEVTSKSNANWVRLKWTNASGTGTITRVNFVAKGSDT